MFEQLGVRARGTTCEAINGISEEAKEIMEDAGEDSVRDAGTIAAVQAVEHHEISRDGTMVAWARSLGRSEVAELLAGTLEQEKAADRRLTDLAEATLNERATSGDGEEGGGGRARSRSSGEGGKPRGGGSGGRSGGSGGGKALDEMDESAIEALKAEDDIEGDEAGGTTGKKRGGGSKAA